MELFGHAKHPGGEQRGVQSVPVPRRYKKVITIVAAPGNHPTGLTATCIQR